MAGCLDGPTGPPNGTLEPDSLRLADTGFETLIAEDVLADLLNRGAGPFVVKSAQLEGTQAALFAVAVDIDEPIVSGARSEVQLSVVAGSLVALVPRGDLEVDAGVRLTLTTAGDTHPSAGCGTADHGPRASELVVPIVWRLLCDFDGDGSDALTCGGDDCDDADSELWPGNPEQCDGIDNDCDGLANADPLLEQDGDQDGFLSCSDCDDFESASHPGAIEVCDGEDNDCDGLANLDPLLETDGDSDGFLSCADCDDAAATTHPGGLRRLRLDRPGLRRSSR